jgi:8-oxo-dGTP pyrophosphatase MutT (NUDIX family)
MRRALQARSPVQNDSLTHRRYAAVALILRVTHRGDPDVLLIKRAEYEGDPWSGHVALPGGRREEGDSDLQHTAIRETREETAIDLARHGSIIGTLDDVVPFSPRLPPIVIRPFVASVDPHVEPVISAELAAAFWVPLAVLRAPTTRVFDRVVARGEQLDVGGFRIGEHFVWGLTERILSDFFERLDAGGSYAG